MNIEQLSKSPESTHIKVYKLCAFKQHRFNNEPESKKRKTDSDGWKACALCANVSGYDDDVGAKKRNNSSVVRS